MRAGCRLCSPTSSSRGLTQHAGASRILREEVLHDPSQTVSDSSPFNLAQDAGAKREEPSGRWSSQSERGISSTDSGTSIADLLKECSRSRDLERGRQLHSQVVSSGQLAHINSLINMYAKCGAMADARSVFDGMINRSTVSWNALLQGYVENGNSRLALELFDGMEEEGCAANARTYLAALTACAAIAEKKDRDLVEKGKAIHSRAAMSGMCDAFVESMLVKMYAGYGNMVHARCVFDHMQGPDTVSWNVLLQGYVDNGESKLAMELFDRMQQGPGACAPNARTYVVALTACGTLAARNCTQMLEQGKAIHSRAAMHGCFEAIVGKALVETYAKCGRMVHAQRLFESMSQPSVFTWNTLLQGFVDNGDNEGALELYERVKEVCAPNARTYLAAVTACIALAGKVTGKPAESYRQWVEMGYRIHSEASANSCSDIYVETGLLNLYAKCGSMMQARRVFDSMTNRDSVAWSTLLHGYVENGEDEVALELFHGMEEHQADAKTYAAAVTACSNLASKDRSIGKDGRWLEAGKGIQSQAVRRGFCDTFVASMLVDLYGKCGNMVHARSLFDKLQHRDVVCWNCLIRGYVENGENELALELISSMTASGITRNSVTYIAALRACGNLMSLERGKDFHAELQERGLEENPVIKTSLVDFYSRCGSMDNAKKIFDSISCKDIVTWNSLMCGYSLQGNTDQVFELYEQMQAESVVPDEVTFLSVLAACSHAGLVDKGKEYFDAMQTKFKLAPVLRHYACMIDLLGRANHLDEALKMVKGMPVEPSPVVWRTILGACSKWKNVDVAKVAYEALIALDHRDPAAYVLMGNIYGGAGMWEQRAQVLGRLEGADLP